MLYRISTSDDLNLSPDTKDLRRTSDDLKKSQIQEVITQMKIRDKPQITSDELCKIRAVLCKMHT